MRISGNEVSLIPGRCVAWSPYTGLCPHPAEHLACGLHVLEFDFKHHRIGHYSREVTSAVPTQEGRLI